MLVIEVMGHELRFKIDGISIWYYVLEEQVILETFCLSKLVKKLRPFTLLRHTNSSLFQNKNGIAFILSTFLHPALIAN